MPFAGWKSVSWGLGWELRTALEPAGGGDGGGPLEWQCPEKSWGWDEETSPVWDPGESWGWDEDPSPIWDPRKAPFLDCSFPKEAPAAPPGWSFLPAGQSWPGSFTIQNPNIIFTVSPWVYFPRGLEIYPWEDPKMRIYCSQTEYFQLPSLS